MLAIRHCRRALLDAVQKKNMFVSVTFIATLIQFVTTSLVYKIKFYRRKSMWAADEKPIIN